MIKKWIFSEFIKENIANYIFGFLAIIMSSLLSMLLPRMLGNIMDDLAYGMSPLSQIQKQALLMLLVAALLFLMKFIYRNLVMGKARDLECALRAKLFAKFQQLTPSFYSTKKTGDLMSYAINDLNAIRMAFSFGLVFLIEGVLVNAITVVVMASTVHPSLTLISLGPVLICLVVIAVLRTNIRRRFLKVQESFADLSDKIQENLSGIRVIKAFVQEKAEIEKLDKAGKNRINAQLNYVKVSGALGPSINICFGFSFTLVLILGSQYVKQGVISLGDFIAFNTYLGLIIMPINHLGKVVEVWQKAFASMERLNDIITAPVEVEEEEHPVTHNFKGRVVIKNLTFAYPNTDKKVLDSVSFTIPRGKTVAITGPTGSGKTTLVNLLTRLYQIEDGHIFLDGIDINAYSLEALRESIGCVPQDNFLFSAAIKENIKFFTEMFSDSQTYDAARAVAIYDAITGFPDGFETITGERGVTLSGGQKQRVSMARAVIKEPALLIFDDSLSAVDTQTEKQILDNIHKILKNKTGLMISHRVSTIKNADIIIVLDQGRIIEEGSHDELMAKQGEYYNLYTAQNEAETGEVV